MLLPENKYANIIAPEALASISGRELLIHHLGYWPSFHDFEVISITLERALVSACARDLKAVFYIFDLNKSPNDPSRKQGAAELLFTDIENLKIDGFNHQNPIIGLSMILGETTDGSSTFQVAWGGTCVQHEVSFTCGSIAVLRVTDLNPFQKSLVL